MDLGVSAARIEGRSAQNDGFWKGRHRGKAPCGIPRALIMGKRLYRVSIDCVGDRRGRHRHAAITLVDGRRVVAEAGTQDQAMAALAKALDPEVETVKSEAGEILG